MTEEGFASVVKGKKPAASGEVYKLDFFITIIISGISSANHSQIFLMNIQDIFPELWISIRIDNLMLLTKNLPINLGKKVNLFHFIKVSESMQLFERHYQA